MEPTRKSLSEILSSGEDAAQLQNLVERYVADKIEDIKTQTMIEMIEHYRAVLHCDLSDIKTRKDFEKSVKESNETRDKIPRSQIKWKV